MTIAELEAKWGARVIEWRELGVTVLGEKIAAEILDDLRSVGADVHLNGELCSPSDAGPQVGYHPGSIARLIKQGKLRNYGTKNRPLVKLSELPKKPPRRVAASHHTAGAKKRVRLSSEAERSTPTLVLDAAASRLARPGNRSSS